MASSARSLLGVPITGRRNCSLTSPVTSLLPSPADLLNPGIKLGSPALQVDSLPTELSGKPQVEQVVKNPPANAGDMRDSGLIPGSGRSPGEGNGYPLQYSGLENSMGLQRVRHN